MKTRLIGLTLLFLTTYFLMLNSALAAPFTGTCTPSPAKLTLQTGAKVHVNYHCSKIRGLNYQLTFTFTTTPGGLTVTPPTTAKSNPYPVTVKAGQTTGPFTVMIHTLNLGTGPLSVPNQTPLTGNVVFTPKPNVTASDFTCTPSTIYVGGTSTCSIKYKNTGTANATRVVVTPSVQSGPGSVTVTTACPATLPKTNGTCTEKFTYTSPAVGSGKLSVAYTDKQGETPASGTQTVTVTPAPAPDVTASDFTCTPSTIYVGGTSTCSIKYKNTGTANATGVVVTPSIQSGPGSVTVTTACPATLPKTNGTCTEKFTYTSSTVGSGKLSVAYTDKQGETPASGTQTVTVQSAIVAASNFSCTPSTIYVGGTSNCKITYTNTGTANATGVVVTPSIQSGPGSVTVTTACPATLPKTNGTCTEKFTYTSPAVGSGKLSVAYTDTQGNAPASGTKTVTVTPAPAPDVTASDFTCTPSTIYVGGTSTCSIKYTNTGTANATRVVVTPSVQSGPGSVTVTTACPATLAKTNGTCTEKFTYTSPTAGSGKLSVAYTDTQGETPASGTKTVTVTAAPVPIFSEVVTNYPFIVGQFGPHPYKFGGAFVFQNNTANSITFSNSLQPVTQTLSSPFTTTTCIQVQNFLPTYTECSSLHGTLPSGATCAACFKQNSTAPTKKSYTFSGKLSYEGISTTASKTITTKAQYRQIFVMNMCPGPVWVAFSTDIAYRSCEHNSDCPAGTECLSDQCQVPAPTSGTSCTSNSDCPTGSYCAPNKYCSTGCTTKPSVCPQFSTCSPSNGLCYGNVPTNTGVSSKLAFGGSNIYQIPNIAKNAANNVWQGSIVARTGCSIQGGKFSCITGNCGNTGTASACLIGQAPKQPVTEAKFSLQLKSKDSYYIDISNGFNIPIAIQANSASVLTPYDCGMVGAPIGEGAFTLCPWKFNMIAGSQVSPYYPASSKVYKAYHTFVTKGTTPCSGPNYTCSTGVCGISQENVKATSGSPKLTCGKLLGFWSTLKLCSVNASAYNAVLGCNNSSPTKLDWLRCSSGPGGQGASCYAADAMKNKCCGCPYWQVGNSNYPYLKKIYTGINLQVYSPYPNNESCKKDTKYWINNVLLPDLIWMKQGCESVKVFPQDSAASLFTCNSNKQQGEINKEQYSIMFCPNFLSPSFKTGGVNGTPVYIPPSQSSSRMHHESLLKRIMHKLEGYVSFVEH